MWSAHYMVAAHAAYVSLDSTCALRGAHAGAFTTVLKNYLRWANAFMSGMECNYKPDGCTGER